MILKLFIILLMVNMATSVGKDKKKPKAGSVLSEVRPHTLTTVAAWYNLGAVKLKKVCKEINIPSSGSLTQLAQRLFEYYHGTVTTQQQGKRVSSYVQEIEAY